MLINLTESEVFELVMILKSRMTHVQNYDEELKERYADDVNLPLLLRDNKTRFDITVSIADKIIKN